MMTATAMTTTVSESSHQSSFYLDKYLYINVYVYTYIRADARYVLSRCYAPIQLTTATYFCQNNSRLTEAAATPRRYPMGIAFSQLFNRHSCCRMTSIFVVPGASGPRWWRQALFQEISKQAPDKKPMHPLLAGH